jgi:serine/threonine protein kinase
VAVKILSGKDAAAGALGERLAERSTLRHPHLTRILETFRSNVGFAVAMQFLPDACELFDLCGTLDGSATFKIARDLASVGVYLARKNVVHRDVKPENCLFHTATATTTLIDLGSLRAAGQVAAVQGTLGYLAPEARGAQVQRVEVSLDAWSAGVTVAVVISGTLANSAGKARQAAGRILAREGNEGRTSMVLLGFAAEMMEPDPASRPTLAWLSGNLEASV